MSLTYSFGNRIIFINKSPSNNPVVTLLPNQSPDWLAPMTLYIHGFNSNPWESNESFVALMETMRNVTHLPGYLTNNGWLVTWQGYISLGLSRNAPTVSKAAYPFQIPSAKLAARALYEYITKESKGVARINIIAHSLGCRVTLEMLGLFAQSPSTVKVTFPFVAFMAPAIPVYFFDRVADIYQRSIARAEKVIVLHSTRDLVLKMAFPVGQTAAGEGFYPAAVGSKAGPLSFWKHRERTENGHSGYFFDSTTARFITKSLGLAVAHTAKV